jgi:hypothetical protein
MATIIHARPVEPTTVGVSLRRSIPTIYSTLSLADSHDLEILFPRSPSLSTTNSPLPTPLRPVEALLCAIGTSGTHVRDRHADCSRMAICCEEIYKLEQWGS